MRIIAPMILALIAVLAAPAALAGPAAGEVGSEAADFSLQALDESFHSLSDYPNKVVLLMVVGWG